jgi:2-oxo-4-hydroxy-4-carboxy--5-ureidoimidazoline (OHCU) decarboxylase
MEIAAASPDKRRYFINRMQSTTGLAGLLAMACLLITANAAAERQHGPKALSLTETQLADELNRPLSGRKVSGYIVLVHLVTRENIAFDGGPRMLSDPENDYRKVYRRIWKR